MKRITALLLSVMLLSLLALPGLAADYTLDEKLYKQVKDGSGLRATLKTQKTGGAFSVLDPATNAALNALLPGAELSLRFLSGVGTLKGQEELELNLLKGGQQLADLHLIKDSQFEQLTSSLLGAARYVDERDGGVLMALLSGKDPTWPGIEGLLFKLNTAESTWQGLVAQKLDNYLVKLTVWLQGYTRTESLKDAAGRPQTRVSVSVPPLQLKAQVKQLLLDVYSDQELLALLAQELDARQTAAWLQPGMMNSFFQALDRLPLEDNLESTRLLDENGLVIENRLTLPLGGAQGLDRAVYSFTADEDGGQSALILEHSPKLPGSLQGAVTSLAYEGGQTEGSPDITFAGTLTHTPEPAQEDFTVDAASPLAQTRAYTFNLLFVPGPEVVDSAAQSSTRAFEFTLRVVPQDDVTQAAQIIRANAQLSSRLNSRSATYFTGTLTWLDEGSQAQIKADFSGNSAPPWAMAAIDPNGAIRVDTMTAAQLKTLGLQVRTTLEKGLTAALARLLTPATTAP